MEEPTDDVITRRRKMKNQQIRLLFMVLATVVVMVTIAMHVQMGRGSHKILRDFFSLDWDESHPKGSHHESRIFPKIPEKQHLVDPHTGTQEKSLGVNGGGRNTAWSASEHSHDHNQEVRFVLRESDLGAPAFVGRNILDLDGDVHGKPRGGGSNLPDRFRNLTNWRPVPVGVNSVAIGCAITTRKQVDVTADNLMTQFPFFKGLMTSFCVTATAGYDYHVYVAHDHDDPFFQTELSHGVFQLAFHGVVSQHCPNTFNISLHFVECNHTGRPAWAQNDAMMAAYMDNMEYYYRVNDDTVMETSGWTEKMIAELDRYNPSKVGVVGPWFREGNFEILTHDFVHRTHIDIFGFYYPRVFTDWFADDWITGVYRPERCRKLPMVRVKHTMEQGSRYVVHFEKAGKVAVEIEIGKALIKRWLERRDKTGGDTLGESSSKNVISLALHGNRIDKLYGAMRYAQLVPIMYPQWRTRFYVSAEEMTAVKTARVLRIIARKLELSGVEVVKLNKSITDVVVPSLWPYLVVDDYSVKRFLVRDPDTRPSEREAALLEEWLGTGAAGSCYCVRDTPAQAGAPLTPGLVGGIPDHLRRLAPIIGGWRHLLANFTSEALFLQRYLWPRVKGHVSCHDSVSCLQWPGSHPFPILRKDNQFIGQRFDANDEIVDAVDTLTWNVNFTAAECVFVKNTGFSEAAVKAVIRHRPVFWSQDFHVTPIMDVKSLLTPIGIRVIDKSLSWTCHSVGTCAKNLKVINGQNGMTLGPKVINEFYEAYRNDSEMALATTFICTLPVAMCEAFWKFKDKGMLIVATLRYDMGRSDRANWTALNGLLAAVHRKDRGVVAANNLYDAKYIEYFTGIQPVLLPNFCAYMKDSYNPTRRQYLVAPIHNTQLNEKFFADFDNAVIKRDADLSIFPMREMYPQYLFSDFAAHPGIIYIPYQVSMVSLTEQYRMNIPLFFPSLNLLTKWHLDYQVVRQRSWNLHRNRVVNGSVISRFPADPGSARVPDPNNDLDGEAVRFWLRFADFYQWPHITYFDSVLDLVDKMLAADLGVISQRMAEHNRKTRVDIKAAWSQILLKLTGESTTSGHRLSRQ